MLIVPIISSRNVGKNPAPVEAALPRVYGPRLRGWERVAGRLQLSRTAHTIGGLKADLYTVEQPAIDVAVHHPPSLHSRALH